MSIPFLVMLLIDETMLNYVSSSILLVVVESATQELSLSSVICLLPVNFWISSLNVAVQAFIFEYHNIISSGQFFHFLSFRF